MEQSCITVSLDNSLNEDGYICHICSPFKYEPNENKFYQHLIMSHFKEKLLIRYGILVYNTVHKCGGCKEKFNEADLFLEHCALTHDKVFIKKMHDKETMTKSEYEDILSKDKNKHRNKEMEIIEQLNEFGREYREGNQFHQDANSKSSMENTQLDSNLPLQQQNGYKSITPKIKKCSNVGNFYSRPPYSISQMPLHQKNGLFLLQNGYKPITPKLKKPSDVTISYPCPDSLKNFPESSKPEQNPLIHTKIKAFSCNLCNKSFTKKLGLNIHKCSGVAFLYSCPDCLKTFPTPSQLESHKLIHTGMKQFFCQICFKGFNQKNNLENHRCEQESEGQRFDVSHLCTTIMD